MATKQKQLNVTPAMLLALAEHQARLTVQGFKTDVSTLVPLIEEAKESQTKAMEVSQRFAGEGGVLETAKKAFWSHLTKIADRIKSEKIAPDFAISAFNVALGDLPVNSDGKPVKAYNTIRMYRKTFEDTVRAVMREDWQTKVAPAAELEPDVSLIDKPYDTARKIITAVHGVDADQDYIALNNALADFSKLTKACAKPITAKKADEKEGTPERVARKAVAVKSLLQVISDAKTLIQVLDSEREYEKTADADKAKALEGLTQESEAAPETVEDEAQQAQAA